MNTVFIGLGSNLGDRLAFLNIARELISKKIGLISLISSVYETEPWGKNDQPWFLNQVIMVETDLNYMETFELAKQIEQEMKRSKQVKWGQREIDIDVLFFNDLQVETDIITIPHCEIKNRKFVLLPLNEIASDLIFPGSELSINFLLKICPDRLIVRKFED